MNVNYVHEKIHYDKTKDCGWTYKEVEYRIDYKTKKTRFYTYKGYCQWDNRDWDEDTYVESISIHGGYRSFFVEKKTSRLKRDIRNVEYVWGKGYKFSEL